MRILIYGINYAPELTGIGKYTGDMANWLVEQGHEIRVITAPPYYPAWRVEDGHSPWQYSLEKAPAGIEVYRCPLWVPKNPSGVQRIVHLISFTLSSLPIALWQGLTWRPDLVWAVAPSICSGLGARLAASLGRSKTWLHIQDFEIDTAFGLGILPSNRLRGIASALENWLLRSFDRVSTIADRMLKRLKGKGVNKSRLILFPNWVDTNAIYPLNGMNPFRAQLQIPHDRVVVLYSGSMGKKQGLEIAIEAARYLADRPEILFILCGEGTSRPGLQKLANGLRNVRFLPLQPADRLNLLLNLADIHLLPQRAGAADLVMPSKLGGILACGGAVIATAAFGTELATTVSEAGGIVCMPEDALELAKHILYLAGDRSRRQAMQRNARAYALDNLSKEIILHDFETSLYWLCQKKRRKKKKLLVSAVR